MPKRSLSAWLYLVLVFLSGAAVGVFGYRLYTVKTVSASPNDPAAYRRRYIAEMSDRLHLTKDQVSQVASVMDATRQRYHELHERAKPEMQAIHREQVAKIEALLNDTQKTEYEKFLAEREAQRERAQAAKPKTE